MAKAKKSKKKMKLGKAIKVALIILVIIALPLALWLSQRQTSSDAGASECYDSCYQKCQKSMFSSREEIYVLCEKNCKSRCGMTTAASASPTSRFMPAHPDLRNQDNSAVCAQLERNYKRFGTFIGRFARFETYLERLKNRGAALGCEWAQ